MSFSFHVPTNLVFGQGAIQKLHKQRLPGKHALIVISSGKSTRANGYLDIVQDQLTQAGVTYTVFDKILANPVLDNVMDGAACARANGCDFVLGLGGGSSIDAAKAIAMMAPNEGNYWDYMYGRHRRRQKDEEQAPAHCGHSHHRRHRDGAGCLDRGDQRGNQGEDERRQQEHLPCPLHRGP